MVSIKTKSGFSLIALVAIVVVVGLLSFVGYTAYNKINSKSAASTTATTQTQAPVANDVQLTPTIGSPADLTTAEASLDQTDTSSSTDLTSLDTQLNSF